jgi:hypothetical protein
VHRFPTSAAFVDALADALHAPAPPPAPVTAAPPPTRRASAAPVAALVAGVMLLTIVGIGAALLITRDDPPPAADTQTAAATQPTTTAPPPSTTVGQATTPPAQPQPAPAANRVGVEQAAELNDQAFVLMGQERWREALPLLERAVPALRGTYSDDFRYEAYAEFNLGLTLAELGRCPEAVPHLERSRDLQGNRREIREALRECGADEKPKRGEKGEKDD